MAVAVVLAVVVAVVAMVVAASGGGGGLLRPAVALRCGAVPVLTGEQVSIAMNVKPSTSKLPSPSELMLERVFSHFDTRSTRAWRSSMYGSSSAHLSDRVLK